PWELPERDLPVPPYALGAWLSDGSPAPEDLHIPAAYLRASVAQRRALLAGLLGTDGEIRGELCFRTRSGRLADDVYELVVGLGHQCADTTGGTGQRCLTIAAGARRITAVRAVGSVPVRCIAVDND